MKNSSLPCIMFTLFLLPSCSCEEKKKEPTISAAEDILTTKEVIKVKKGEEFTFKLPSNPSTGYSWHVLMFNSGRLEFAEKKFEHETKEVKPGTGGWDIFTFKALKSDKPTSITLEYRREWEKGKAAAKQHLVTVEFE